jgi:hypothetical protein
LECAGRREGGRGGFGLMAMVRGEETGKGNVIDSEVDEEILFLKCI